MSKNVSLSCGEKINWQLLSNWFIDSDILPDQRYENYCEHFQAIYG
jgi:hypothetical protein